LENSSSAVAEAVADEEQLQLAVKSCQFANLKYLYFSVNSLVEKARQYSA